MSAGAISVGEFLGEDALAVVEQGGVAVVDARILGGYSPATAAAMARGEKADRGG